MPPSHLNTESSLPRLTAASEAAELQYPDATVDILGIKTSGLHQETNFLHETIVGYELNAKVAQLSSPWCIRVDDM